MARRKSPSVTLAGAGACSKLPTETLGRPGDPAHPGDPTPERLRRAGLTVAIQTRTGNLQVLGAPVPILGFDGVIRLAQAPLDRLAARDQLDPTSPDQNHQLFQAGDKLRDHHHLAGLSGFAANDLNGGGGGHPATRTPITETMEKHRRALRVAEGAMDADAWRAVQLVVIEEQALEDAGRAVGFVQRHAAAAVALDRLRRGLTALAELWGYLPPPRREQTPPAAANDAAPTMDAERRSGTARA